MKIQIISSLIIIPLFNFQNHTYLFFYINFPFSFQPRKIGRDDDDDDDFMEEEETEEVDLSDEPPTLGMNEQKLNEERTNTIVAYFFFSVVWSVGATLDANSRVKFDEFFRALCDMEGVKDKYPKYD